MTMHEALVGRTIVGTRVMTQEEKDFLDWYGHVEILILDDGTELVAAADDEGNNGGALWLLEPGGLLA